MTQIRAKAIADGSTEPTPAARIAAIANKVRRPAAFAAAQQAYRDLSERHTALRDEERRLIKEMLEGGGETNASGKMVQRIREVDAELSSLSDSIRTALENVFQARQPFAKAITEALAPERATAARRALAAAMALIDELGMLDMIDREISSVGGQPGRHPLPAYRGWLEPMLARLRRIAVE
jgi:hypothetical protein